MGAGRKIGLRITHQLKNHSDYNIRYIEPAEEKQAELEERGVKITPLDGDLYSAEAVLAVPADVISDGTEEIVP